MKYSGFKDMEERAQKIENVKRESRDFQDGFCEALEFCAEIMDKTLHGGGAVTFRKYRREIKEHQNVN